jgi:iron-sulfur cluster assembly protein/iron-sulfur cluster insertion protein|tara:strand:+ start:3165 stop:3479 length:315 start_codon:yes stop_codon:yes gene_type:complete
MITLTSRAAKAVTQLQSDKGTDLPLRIFISSGGCSGFEYGMGFDPGKDDDLAMESEGVAFRVDKKSLEQLDGSVVDFDDGLMGKGFEIKNPNAESTCGCGKSFA